VITFAFALLLEAPDTSVRARLVPTIPSGLAGAEVADTIRKKPSEGSTVFSKKRDSVVTDADSVMATKAKAVADSATAAKARAVTDSVAAANRATTTVATPSATPTPASAPAIAPTSAPTIAAAERAVAQDTTPRRRKRVVAVEYSDGYGKRLTWHRWLSYPIVPLFAAQYYLGEKLMDNQRGASDLTKNGHRAIATMTAGLYTFNTVTGVMNLWEGRNDPSGRFRKWLHAAMFVTADAGFIYGASLAGDAQKYGQEFREKHRNVELASIGISVASWAMMLLWKE
jgi:hypothetical protein